MSMLHSLYEGNECRETLGTFLTQGYQSRSSRKIHQQVHSLTQINGSGFNLGNWFIRDSGLILDLSSVLPCAPTGLTIGKETEVMGETISTTNNHAQTNRTENVSDPVGQYGVENVTDSVGVGAFENEKFGVAGAGMAMSAQVVEEAVALTPNADRAVTDENALEPNTEDSSFDDGIYNGIDDDQDNINLLTDETDAADEGVDIESTEPNTVQGLFYLFSSKMFFLLYPLLNLPNFPVSLRSLVDLGWFWSILVYGLFDSRSDCGDRDEDEFQISSSGSSTAAPNQDVMNKLLMPTAEKGPCAGWCRFAQRDFNPNSCTLVTPA
ncbi:hypothetical protein HK098_006783 [Nowakowskiella sp. JEL0407]|nr:hypothetical protein HK098_006783 [Nowakowskiella sp. JEL0407]